MKAASLNRCSETADTGEPNVHVCRLAPEQLAGVVGGGTRSNVEYLMTTAVEFELEHRGYHSPLSLRLRRR